MNGRILEESPFKRIYIQPAANDAGTALGAALHFHTVIAGGRRSFVMEHAAFGVEFQDREIEAILNASRLPYRHTHDIVQDAARLIAEGKIVGWFQGRAEIGPRALGQRSILADPRNPAMKDILNRLKRREAFRPFAPAVLKEVAHEYFEGCDESPFMLVVYRVHPDLLHEWAIEN